MLTMPAPGGIEFNQISHSFRFFFGTFIGKLLKEATKNPKLCWAWATMNQFTRRIRLSHVRVNRVLLIAHLRFKWQWVGDGMVVVGVSSSEWFQFYTLFYNWITCFANHRR